MNHFKRDAGLKKYLKSKILVLFLIIMAVVLINASWKMYKKSVQAEKYMNAVLEEYSALENQYESAGKDLDYIKSGTGFEKEVRAKFDLSREGEKAIMIIEEEPPEIQEPEKKGFWGTLKRWASF